MTGRRVYLVQSQPDRGGGPLSRSPFRLHPSAWPRRHGIGHPTRCSLLGVRPADEQQLSDHYGLLASLRY